MEPIETRQSMFDDPSNGSKATMYFPRLFVSTTITCSFSSDIITPTLYDELSMFMKS